MKNIQAQFTDLLEGRMSQSNFMRSVRRDFPQFISSTTSYNDSVKILKGKRILSEAKLPDGVYGHNPNAEAPQKPGIDQLNYYQVYHGIQYELALAPEITDEAYVKARKKVVDTILKDPDAYKDLQLANFKAVKRMDKDLEMKDVKEDNKVDKANGMKVMRKDAPASANTSKKESKKKSKVQQMTQAPKKHKGVEVMDVPGKATVLALKEHILDELTTPNLEHEHINKGSRIKKKDAKEYDASKVGSVTDFDGHMATVKWDNGTEEHVMPNVLTKRDIPKHPEADERFGRIPDSPFMKKEEVKEEPELKEDRGSKLKRLKERLVKALRKEAGDVVKAADGTVLGVTKPGQGKKLANSIRSQSGGGINPMVTAVGG